MAKPIFIIAGIGRGSGTGAASAKLFAKNGYRVALVSRTKEHLDALAAEIVKDGGEAASFPVPSYNYADTFAVFDALRKHNWTGEGSEIRGALYNAGSAPFKTFLDITEQDLAGSLETQVTGAFAFSHGAISAFKENAIDEKGRRGVLIFTGATASVRGNTFTSAFAAGKHAVRALSQSLAKAYGKENIHVAHAIIDGGILTGQRLERFESEEERETYEANADARLLCFQSYLYLVNQDRSSWTWELDLRPAHEKW